MRRVENVIVGGMQCKARNLRNRKKLISVVEAEGKTERPRREKNVLNQATPARRGLRLFCVIKFIL